MSFDRPNLKYTPHTVEVGVVDKSSAKSDITSETDILVDKLMHHLASIQEWRDRIEAFDYLIDNAKKLAGNLKFTTEDVDIIKAINGIGGTSNYVDMALFEKAIDLVIKQYQTMSLVSFVGGI
jgi:hypothetical protein